MSWLTKIIAGSEGRSSRLHTERDELIPLYECRQVPKVILQYIVRRISGERPIEPWWPLSVIPIIDKHLSSKSRIVEFGCGSSTIWLAQRAASVVAIEDSQEWRDSVAARLSAAGLNNVTIRLARDADYYDLTDFIGQKFDLAVIDGSYRWRCVEAVLPLMSKGSIVYLDNSDADKDLNQYPNVGMRHEAQRMLEFYAAERGGSLFRLPGLISGELHAGEGMILKLP